MVAACCCRAGVGAPTNHFHTCVRQADNAGRQIFGWRDEVLRRASKSPTHMNNCTILKATVVDDPTGSPRPRPRPRTSATAGHVVQGTRPSVPSTRSRGCTSSWRQASLWHFSPKIIMDSCAQLMMRMPLPLPLPLLMLLLLQLEPLYSQTDWSMRILY